MDAGMIISGGLLVLAFMVGFAVGMLVNQYCQWREDGR